MLNFNLLNELGLQIESLDTENRLRLWNDYAKANNKPVVHYATQPNIVQALDNDLSLYLKANCDKELGNSQYFYITTKDNQKQVEFFDFLDSSETNAIFDGFKIASWLLSGALKDYTDILNTSRLELVENESVSLSGIYHCYQSSEFKFKKAEPNMSDFASQQEFLIAWLEWADTILVPNFFTI